MTQPALLAFDVNETLLDLRALDPHFERIFGEAAVRERWFGLVLRTAMSLTITGAYHDFVTVGGGSLQMVAEAIRLRGKAGNLLHHPAVAGPAPDGWRPDRTIRIPFRTHTDAAADGGGDCSPRHTEFREGPQAED